MFQQKRNILPLPLEGFSFALLDRLSISVVSVMTAQRLLTGMRLANCEAGQTRLWELSTSFPAIDPVFWLDLHARDELKALGCHFLGKAGTQPLPSSADMVRYMSKDGTMMFRKDTVQKGCSDRSSCPRVFMGSATASKGFRAEASLQQLQSRIEQFKPDLVLLDILVQGLKPDEVCQVLKELHGEFTTLAWFQFTFEAFGLPVKEARYLWAAGRVDAQRAQSLIVKAWDGCKAWAKVNAPVQAETCLVPKSRWRSFLLLIHSRSLHKRASPGEQHEDKGKAPATGEGQAAGASPEQTEGDTGKRRRKMNVADFAKGAVEAGFLRTESPILPSKFQRAYDDLSRCSPCTFVHAAALVQQSEDMFKSQGKRPFLLTDASLSNWKRVTLGHATLPPLKSTSVILYVHGETLHELLPEECLAMMGFDLNSVHMNLFSQTAARQAVADSLPPAPAAAMIVLASNLCTLLAPLQG